MEMNYYGIPQDGDGSIFCTFLHAASFAFHGQYGIYFEHQFFSTLFLKKAESMAERYKWL